VTWWYTVVEACGAAYRDRYLRRQRASLVRAILVCCS